MQGKELHDFLFKLYDYADSVADKIQPWETENNNHFLTLVLIESYFDRVGRGEIRKAAEQANSKDINPRDSLAEAHRRIDLLRNRMSMLSKEYDFNEVLDGWNLQQSHMWRNKNVKND